MKMERHGEMGQNEVTSAGGEKWSVEEEENRWDAREVAVFGERMWNEGWSEGRAEGWEAALDAVGARRIERGGSGFEGRGELRRLVGERFATALEGVWEASLRQLRSTGPGGNGGLGIRVGRDGFRPRTGTLDQSLRMRGVGMGGGRKGGARSGRGSGGEDGGVIRDEVALAFKAKIERQIRKLTRQMEGWLEVRSSYREENVVRRCRKCRRFADAGWKFCPFDGSEVSVG